METTTLEYQSFRVQVRVHIKRLSTAIFLGRFLFVCFCFCLCFWTGLPVSESLEYLLLQNRSNFKQILFCGEQRRWTYSFRPTFLIGQQMKQNWDTTGTSNCCLHSGTGKDMQSRLVWKLTVAIATLCVVNRNEKFTCFEPWTCHRMCRQQEWEVYLLLTHNLPQDVLSTGMGSLLVFNL